MIFFLLGMLSVMIFLFVLVAIQSYMDKREVEIRKRIIRENLEFIKTENARLIAERAKLMDGILSDPAMRRMYAAIDTVIDRLVKKQGTSIVIPEGVSLELSCEILNCLLISFKSHISETKNLQKLFESEDKNDTRS